MNSIHMKFEHQEDFVGGPTFPNSNLLSYKAEMREEFSWTLEIDQV